MSVTPDTLLSVRDSSGLRIRPVREGTPDLQALTFPRFRPLLEPGKALPDTALMLVAERAEQGDGGGEGPLGLVYVHRPSRQDQPAHLMSLAVRPSRRRLGIGRALLAAAEQAVAAHPALVTGYSDDLRARTAFEALLDGQGWAPPALHRVRLRGIAGWADAAAADWQPLLARLAQGGLTLADWNDVGPAEREAMQALLDSGAVRADFSPFSLESWHIPALTLVIRQQGRVVGWVQGLPGEDPASVCYVNGAIHPGLARSGALIAAIVDVCRRQAASLGQHSVCVWQTDADNMAMQRFMERHLAPRRTHLLKHDRFYERQKPLAGGAEAR